MPRVTLDTSEAQSFELAEPGPYPMVVSSVDLETTKKNDPMIKVDFGWQDPAAQQRYGYVTRRYMLKGKGAGFTRELIKALTGEDIPVGATIDIDTDDLVSRPCVVKIGHREYEGRTYNEAESVVAAS